jgi:hypothetical protein
MIYDRASYDPGPVEALLVSEICRITGLKRRDIGGEYGGLWMKVNSADARRQLLVFFSNATEARLGAIASCVAAGLLATAWCRVH